MDNADNVDKEATPASPQPDDASATLRGLLNRYADEPGALLPILHALQDTLGYVAPDAVPAIAEALNLSRAEVHGVISYYHDFRSEAQPAHRLQICCAEACQTMGAQTLLDHARAVLACDENLVSANGNVTVAPVYCLGLCALSPALALDGEVYARMTPEKLAALLARVGDARVKPAEVKA